MISNFCPKCGKALCICLFLGLPVIEAINSPPEEHCSAAQLCTEQPLATEPWSPDAPHYDHRTTNQPTIEPVVGMGAGASTAAAPLPPGDWSVAANSSPLHHSYRRSAALYQSDNGAWMSPLTLRSISSS